ncbi:hypothetical protein TPHA_0C00550 [Tetrapisispora phaffii CBS 4417]|uniref:Uncharacterized protein n=1 Tax=Tetrapisispora phaffii (strain ATCC 24235 / CBS 4417 / NBRC 1672 / NRRL Y-8282 / UCD 70-5) TaxID=1071381 RepID=G8BR36_TETPH|nr:hypothetical protein TPHA_0C00550 [Tetrapisispora phaffii CBS 4417]CCE62212.1 hypothetical protein TPHA_0C00550 [Tetrapisispora phaffii CBS 4417]
MSDDRFDKLGNSIENESIDKTQSDKLPIEIVKTNNRTSKKSKEEQLPPTRIPKKTASGNEAFYRDKNIGRYTNVEEHVPKQAIKSNNVRYKTELKKVDKHSRTGKVDTMKKINNGWGNDLNEWEFEQYAEEDVKKDKQNDLGMGFDGGPEVSSFPLPMTTLSFQEYLEEQNDFNRINKVPSINNKNINSLDDELIIDNEPEILSYPTHAKSYTSHHHIFRDDKKFLNYQASEMTTPRTDVVNEGWDTTLNSSNTPTKNFAIKKKGINLEKLPSL